MQDVISLAAGELRLDLRPDLGGSIAGCWWQGLPVLRSTDPPATLETSRAAGCYPLVPYSNRLGYRRFRFGGRDHTTAPNFDADCPHSLHGVAWQRPWQVAAAADAAAELAYDHAPDDHWPFAFAASQRFELDAGGLTIRLSCRNTAAEPQPVGLGWHPYFPKRQRSRLHAEVAGRWDSDASGLPTRRVPQSGIDGDVVHLSFDHCFDGFAGAARIRDERLSLKLTSSLPYLVVYTPADKAYFCVEPVGHVSNAIHMSDPAAHGLRTLQPGERLEAWMRIEVAPA